MSSDLVEAYLRAAELHSARSRDMAATAWRVTVLCWSLIVGIPAFLLANEAPDPAITAGAVAVIVAAAAVHLFMFLPASYNGTASEQKYYVYMRNKALEAAGDAACRIGNRRGEAVADLEPVAKRKIWASGVYHVQLVTTGGLVAAACVALLTRQGEGTAQIRLFRGRNRRINALLPSEEGTRDRPLRFYSPELLFSPEARLGWVEPDVDAVAAEGG